ncbi:hypothetical protein R3W88_024625 [Solanum pinnatisectum]|uniref:Uncharacterized protein n=1 Tax=Solanum pinnatisectum TaxID=50273 RepID=A0AAV9M4M6_9SOLN|nr:hypothetical protein R3W88_024625 [Solanum pinnatisectum]
MISMILLTPRINQNVINKHNNKYVNIWLKHFVHKVHECYRSISLAKIHDKKLIMTIMGPEYCLWNITLSYLELMIDQFEVYLRKASGTLKLIQNIISSNKWILILDSDLVDLTVINTYPKRIIFLPHK